MRLRHLRTVALLVAMPSLAFAAWPETGIVVGDALYSRLGGSLFLVPDGDHGVLVHPHLWHVTSRVDPEGRLLWATDPFTVSGLPEPNLQTLISYRSAADGSGGVWFATQDSSRSLVAVHIGATGVRVGDVVRLREDVTGTLWIDAALTDGAGGMFVVWSESDVPGADDLHAAHVDASGQVMGPAEGVPVFGGPGRQVFGGAVADAAGGLLVMTPEGGTTIQRLDAVLMPRWGAGAVVAAPAVSGEFALAATGDGGAFVAWPEASPCVRVQRLGANGRVAPGWPMEGTRAASPSLDPRQLQVISDGVGGACVAWVELRDEPGRSTGEVRLSRVLANGRVAQGFPAPGVLAGGGHEPALPSSSVLVADGTGGCWLAWPDVALLQGQMYAQHVTADGRIPTGWPAEGRALGSEWLNYERVAAVADGFGGVYIAWDQYLYPSRYREARLTRFTRDREPAPSALLSLARVAPDPASGLFTVSATMPDDRPARLELFDLAGRISHVRAVAGRGERGLTLDASGLAAGVHWLRLTHPTGVRTARIVVVH